MSEFHCINCAPGEIHTSASKHPFRSAKKDAMLGKVEDAWYAEAKGDFDLTEDPDPREVALVQAMVASAQEFVALDGSTQYTANGVEIDIVTTDEIARRVASALSTLWWGWGS